MPQNTDTEIWLLVGGFDVYITAAMFLASVLKRDRYPPENIQNDSG
jgi:hypothetical protein